MSLLANLTSDDSIAAEKDSVGSGGVHASGLYPSTISIAYLSKSDGGALALNLVAKSASGQDIKGQLWMTSGTAKGCKNYYEKDGVKNYLPGYLLGNSLALLAAAKEISQMDTEQKVINLYSKEAKAEVPTKVDMLVELLGKDIIIGLIKQTVDKTKKNETTGAYESTGETREENEIDKFFRARDNMTTAEIRAGATEATFIKTWGDKWTDKVRNKASAASGTAGAPKAAGAAAAGSKKPTTSLFN